MRNLNLLFALAFVVACFVACGDDVTNITETTGMQMIEMGEKVPDCTDESKGELIYVLDSAAAFFCVDGTWQSWKGEKGDKGDKGSKGENGSNGTNGEAGKSCTTKQVEDGIEVSCPGSDPVVIKNGKNGINGTNGEAGKSCTTKQVEDGVEVSCPGSDPVVIKNGINGTNGTNGEAGKSCTTKQVEDGVEVSCPGSDPVVIKNGINGTNGTNGTSCRIANDENGVVILQCGEGENVVETKLYKAMCGSVPYDPETHFCYEGNVYEKCGEKNYDLKTMFCAKRDNVVERVYKKITITVIAKSYSKTWMAENLNYKTTAGSYCYNNDENKCATYGRLYTWATAVGKDEDKCGYGHKCNLNSSKIQGVCPDGWHIPDITEWNALFEAVGGISTAGKVLKATSGWNDNGNGSDAYGFSALPAGDRGPNGGYGNEGHYANIASSVELDSENSYYIRMYSTLDYARVNNYYKNYGFSVRCIKN